MYLEILHKAIQDHLNDQADKKTKSPITICLTPFIYTTIQLALNDYIKPTSTFGEVPITEVKIDSIRIYDRTVKIESSNTLDSNFEKRLIEQLSISQYK